MLADADNRSRAAVPAVRGALESDGLLELLSPGALQKRLEQALRSGRSRQVTVGLLFRGQIASAAVSDPVDPARSADALKLIRTGCLTKLFTYALVLQAVTQGILRLDHDAGELLERSWPLAATRLRGISVANLLEHTHGLDDSRLREAPLLDDGRIDLVRLVDHAISDPPLCAPGTLYSYSHIGALFLAAILEQLHGQTYHALLSERLFAPLGIEHRLVPDPKQPLAPLRICPSRGPNLAVPVEHLLKFLESHSRGALDAHASMTRLPGWNSSELGICRGWKCYESGWIGHNSEAPGPAAALRVHAKERIAIVVESGDQAAAPILAAMFGRLLPDLVRIRIPSRLNTPPADTDRYVGKYESEALRVTIFRSDDAALELRAQRRIAGLVEETPFLVTPLRAAQDEVFFPQPSSAHLAPLVQFIGADGNRFRFLWNGKSIWRNVDLPA
jgi:Beta-lactamase